MLTENYHQQLSQWPASGRHIMAQFDDESIIVYQAYKPSIASYAVKNQRFGGDFSFNRMSWIKPNFLWMMFRSGWAMKAGQERVLAVRLKRSFFDEVLNSAVASTFDSFAFASHDAWKEALATSDVRLQWDPDHDPNGTPVERRAVQLGLRGRTLHRYGKEELLGIEDITSFVAEQREHVTDAQQRLQTPLERVYPHSSTAISHL